MEVTRILTCAFLAGLAGYAGVGALHVEAPAWSTIAGRLARVGMRVVRAVGACAAARLLRKSQDFSLAASELAVRCERRGMALSEDDSAGALLCAAAGSLLLCMLWSRSPLGLLVALVGWCAGIPLWASTHERRRSQQLASEMPGVFRTLAMAMSSGETLAQALGYVGEHERGLAAPAFRATSLRLRCGVSSEDALSQLVEELDAPGVGLLATALLISQRTGCPLRSLFQHSAVLVERQGEFERMLSVKTAQVRLSARIVSLLPVVMVCLLALISPDFQRGLTTTAGLLSVFVAAAMDLCALGIIRRLMRGVL